MIGSGPWQKRVTDTGTLFLIVLLSSLPLLLLYFFFERELERQVPSDRLIAVSDMQFQMGNVQSSAMPHLLFINYFVSRFNTQVWEPSPEKAFVETARHLRQAYPGVFEIAVFDGNNRLLPDDSNFPGDPDLLNRFAEDLIAWKSNGSTLIQERFPQYRSFLGPMASVIGSGGKSDIGFLGSLRSEIVSFSRQRSVLFIPHVIPGKPWFMVLGSFSRDPREFAFEFMIREKLFISEAQSIIDLTAPPGTWGKNLGAAAPLLPKALLVMGSQEGVVFPAHGFLWGQVLISPQKRLVVARPDEAEQRFMAGQSKLQKGSAGIFVGFLAFGWLLHLGVFGSFSIRTKLLFLFLYTTGAPLLLLMLSAQGLLVERRQILERKLFSDQERALQEFDQGFLDFVGWIEETTLQKRGPPLPDDASAPEKTQNAVRRLLAHVEPQVCEVFDDTGKSPFRLLHDNRDFTKLMPIFALKISKVIAGINGSEISLKDATREQAVSASVESFGFDTEASMAELFGSLDGIVRIKPSTTPLTLMNLLFFDTRKKIRYTALLGWDDSEIFTQYFRHRIAGFQKNWPEILIGSRDLKGLAIPADFPLSLNTVSLIDRRIERQVTTIHQKLEEKGLRFMVSGLEGKETKAFLYACSTDEGINRTLQKISSRLTLIGLLLMALGSIIGLLISRLFLPPIARLAGGIDSMRKRDFSARVDIDTQDEFGRLGEAFNRMMESLADLEVARIVQDTFFPRDPLRGEGWEVFGTSVSASRVGGDYFDYFPLKDGRWLIIIGDVAGHGVAASLVVAMAKALAFHPANPDSPARLLDLLNTCLQRSVRAKRRYMTCFIAAFDPRTGQLVMSNAGHNYPFLLTGGRAREIKINHPFLGLNSRFPFEDLAITLGPTDLLCFYTDGLVEALCQKREHEQIGYDRLQEALPGLVRPTARETEQTLREWFTTLAKPGPLADDITIVILQKGSAAP